MYVPSLQPICRSGHSQDHYGYATCPFTSTAANVKANCVGERLLQGFQSSKNSGVLCGPNGDLTAMELRDTVNHDAVCSWEDRFQNDGLRWCCCKSGDCFDGNAGSASSSQGLTFYDSGTHQSSTTHHAPDTCRSITSCGDGTELIPPTDFSDRECSHCSCTKTRGARHLP